MKKLILGLTSCIALVGSAFVFTGCSNDKALNSVVESWNKLVASDYVKNDGALDTTLIKNKLGVISYRNNIASQKDNMYFVSNHESFLNNAMFPLRDLASLKDASFKSSLSSSDLKKLNNQLKELDSALTNYTKQIDSMTSTIYAGSDLLYGDYLQYESLASVVISEAIETSDIYLDMVYNNALNCIIAEDAKEVSTEVANVITQKLNLECAKSFYGVFHKLTGSEYICLSNCVDMVSSLDYESTSITKYTTKVLDVNKIKLLREAQKQIKTAEKAAELINDISENFDYATFKLNFETNYPRNSSYADKKDGLFLQYLCIKNYSTNHDYSRYVALSNLISIDLDDSFSALKTL